MMKSMRRRRCGIAGVLLLGSVLAICAPGVALAQEDPPATEPVVAEAPVTVVTEAPEEVTALDRLSSEVLNILIPAFVLTVGGLVTVLLRKISQKTGIQLSSEKIDAWSEVARKAALRGGEWARKKAKDLTEGKKVPGPEVMEVSANWGLDMGLKMKLPDIGRARLESLIEAELYKLRLEEDANLAEGATPRI